MGWANEYGPVVALRQGSEVAIVITGIDVSQNFTLFASNTNDSLPFSLCCAQAATDIMEKESGALVDRPPMIAANELLSGGKRITLVGSGERFRRLRKAVHTHFQVKAVETYKDIQFEQARTLILDILNDPKDHQKHTHRQVSVCCMGFACS